MLPDLQRLIQLQDLDSSIERAKRRIADIPAAQQALDMRLEQRTAGLQAVKDRMTSTSTDRRDIEKTVAEVQGRLSKYKDQLMSVKTNKEYQAMQHEIATAEGLVRSHEDRLLDLMEISEKESADLKAAETALKSEQAAVATEKRELDAEKLRLEAELQRLSSDRTSLAAQISPEALATFARIAHGRKGLAMAEARDGLCAVCHVRMRPQVFNEVRRNEAILQCDSCGRILYFVPAQVPAPAPTPQH